MRRLKWPTDEREKRMAMQAAVSLASNEDWKYLLAMLAGNRLAAGAVLSQADPSDPELARNQGAVQVLDDILRISTDARDSLGRQQ